MSLLKLAVHSADHHLGNVNAAITLVEYGDFQCTHCKKAYPLVKRLLKEKHNELHFVFRHFPFRKFHPHAYEAAVAAESAGKQGKFWEMHDLIFENQELLNAKYLLSLAETINLDLVQFRKDSKSKEVADKIEMDFKSGIRSGVKRTPSFYFNDNLLLTYNEKYESLLDAFLNESEKLFPKSHFL